MSVGMAAARPSLPPPGAEELALSRHTGGRTLSRVEEETSRYHQTISEIRRAKDTRRGWMIKEGSSAAALLLAGAAISRDKQGSSRQLRVPVLGCLIREKAKTGC